MGWWHIKEGSCGIDWNFKSGLVNALPGNDSVENHYGGDKPADILAVMFDTITETVGHLPPEHEIAAAFFYGNGDPKVVELCEKAKAKMHLAYQEQWGRSAYPEEIQAMFQFAAGGTYYDG